MSVPQKEDILLVDNDTGRGLIVSAQDAEEFVAKHKLTRFSAQRMPKRLGRLARMRRWFERLWVFTTTLMRERAQHGWAAIGRAHNAAWPKPPTITDWEARALGREAGEKQYGTRDVSISPEAEGLLLAMHEANPAADGGFDISSIAERGQVSEETAKLRLAELLERGLVRCSRQPRAQGGMVRWFLARGA